MSFLRDLDRSRWLTDIFPSPSPSYRVLGLVLSIGKVDVKWSTLWGSSTGGGLSSGGGGSGTGVKRSVPDGFSQRPRKIGNELKIACGLLIVEFRTNCIIVVNFEDSNVFGSLGKSKSLDGLCIVGRVISIPNPSFEYISTGFGAVMKQMRPFFFSNNSMYCPSQVQFASRSEEMLFLNGCTLDTYILFCPRVAFSM